MVYLVGNEATWAIGHRQGYTLKLCRKTGQSLNESLRGG